MPQAGNIIRKACKKSIEQGITTADINVEKAYCTTEVGDWIAREVEK